MLTNPTASFDLGDLGDAIIMDKYCSEPLVQTRPRSEPIHTPTMAIPREWAWIPRSQCGYGIITKNFIVQGGVCVCVSVSVCVCVCLWVFDHETILFGVAHVSQVWEAVQLVMCCKRNPNWTGNATR